MNNILVVSNLNISYSNSRIINNLSFEVNKGDFFLIVGKNGVGKSTLLKGILGLKNIESGTIKKNFNKSGYMSQESFLIKNFPSTIWEFVLSARTAYSKLFYTNNDKKIVSNNLKKLNLYDLKDKSINSLSIGQRQRVFLCRCLCVSDDIIFLDEPTNSLDINVKNMLYDILYKVNKEGTTVVMISHDKESFKYSTRALILGEVNFVTDNLLNLYEKGEIKFD